MIASGAGAFLDEITRLADQAARHEGCEVVELEVKGEGSRRVLRVYLDKLPVAQETAPAPVEPAPEVEAKPARGPGRHRRKDAGARHADEVSRPAGVTLEDCTAVSRRLAVLLDVSDLLLSTYRLEVSSPGLDRPLKREQDYHRFAGQRVVVKTLEDVAGSKRVEGVLLGLEGGLVRIDAGGVIRQVPLTQVVKARLQVNP